MKGSTRAIMVPRVLVKDDHLSPSSLELYDGMIELITCQDAVAYWNFDWTRCPVCQQTHDDDEVIRHLGPGLV